MYLTILYLPLINFICNGLFGRKIGTYGCYILSIGSSFVTLILGYIAFYEVTLYQSYVTINICPWLHSEYLEINLSLTFDSLTVSMFLAVLTVSFLVIWYSSEYMKDDPHPQRFFAYLSLFTLYMLILISADNYLLMFLGWEGVGICSYLLVGFWYTRTVANTSALSALLYNRVGDMFLTIGLFLMFFIVGNIDYSTLFVLSYYLDENIVLLLGILLLIGAMAKSAQLGLHAWLPQAMEGPTPVSALIHAATMVTAGIYLLIRSSSLIEYSSLLLNIILWLGAITALFAGLCGLFQNDIKKIIAYSTMSQLGYMVVAIGLSSYTYALFHLVNHAFFKACLFMAAGQVIHSCNDNQSITKYGALNKLLPLSYVVFVISSLALLAFPFTAGFYSKEIIISMCRTNNNNNNNKQTLFNEDNINIYEQEFIKDKDYKFISDLDLYNNNIYVYNQTYDFIKSLIINMPLSNNLIYYIVTFTAIITSLYSYKLIYYTFITYPNGSKNMYKYIGNHISQIPMSIPVIILGIFSIFSGYILTEIFNGLGNNYFVDSIYVNPLNSHLIECELYDELLNCNSLLFNSIFGIEYIHHFYKLLPLVASIIMIIIYTYILEYNIFGFKIYNSIYNLYSNKIIWDKIYISIYRFISQRFWYELIIYKYVISPVLNVSYNVSKTLDRGYIELWGPYGLSLLLSNISRTLSKLDSGIITHYSLYMSISIVSSLLLLLYWPIFNEGDNVNNLINDNLSILLYSREYILQILILSLLGYNWTKPIEI